MSARGAAEPPQTIRFMELTSNLPDCSSGNEPIQIVGTPAPSVTRSSCASWSTRSGWRELPGNTCFAPTNVDAYGRPQAVAWNIGTMAMTVSRCETPMQSVNDAPRACRVNARWLYATPFGLPVVPDV